MICVLQSLIKYVRYRSGNVALISDVTNIWKPLAFEVLSGTKLYAGLETATWDNKPPLFEFLNIVIGMTGSYELVFWYVSGWLMQR